MEIKTMEAKIIKILESYITDGYRTERGIYDNDIDDLANELVKLFEIDHRKLLIDYENTVGCMDRGEARKFVDKYLLGK